MPDKPLTHSSGPFGCYWPFWLAVLITGVFLGAGIVTGVSALGFISENGPVENASVAIFLCGAFGFALLRPDLAFGRGWQVGALFLLMAARELDFDKRFMDKGILQIRLYTGDFPFEQKLIGVFFVCFILLTLYRLLRYGGRPFLRGLRAGAAWAWAVALAFITVVVAKAVDGAGRKLAPYGIELSEEMDFSLVVLEEFGELAFALLLVFAVCSWVCRDAAHAT